MSLIERVKTISDDGHSGIGSLVVESDKAIRLIMGVLIFVAVPVVALGQAPYYMGTVVNGDFQANGGSLAGWTATTSGTAWVGAGSQGAYLSAVDVVGAGGVAGLSQNILVPSNASFLTFSYYYTALDRADCTVFLAGVLQNSGSGSGTESIPVMSYRGQYYSLSFQVFANPIRPGQPGVTQESANLTVDDVGLDAPGSTTINPLLPTSSAQGQFGFQGAWSGAWDDPPMASAYQYVMSGTSTFTQIQGFPNGFGPLSVLVDNQVVASNLGSGSSVDFITILGHGVSEFTVSGINPEVDSADPSAFPLQLAFSTPTADFQMIAVPEPATLALIGVGAIGLLALAWRRRRA